jgi:hypothetical protein
MFQKRAAKLLSTLPYSLIFQASRVSAEGKIESGKVQLDKNDCTVFQGSDVDSGVHVLVENDRISNMFMPDGSVNADVLRVCLIRLEGVSVVIPNIAAKENTSLTEKFIATTGRDRLLDFMNRKTADANKDREVYKPTREVILAIHAEANRLVARDRAVQVAQLKASGMWVEAQPEPEKAGVETLKMA